MNLNNFIEINNRKIGQDYPPYIIAEMSANHNGSLEDAFEIIRLAKESGADAIKLQTYTPDTITLDEKSSDFQINEGLWAGKTLYDLYKEAYMPWEWHKPLFDYAKRNEITIFSSPFDKSAIDLLEDLNAPAYKIASCEIVDLPLIKYAAETKKPLIISTGMANADEIEEAKNAAMDAGCRNLAILHCVSGYPAPASEYNLRTIPDMIRKYDCVIGLSDHTLGNSTAIASIALGASLVEKHFTSDRGRGGVDDSFSLEPHEMVSLCRDTFEAWSSLGRVDYGLKSSERGNVKFRRSLYFVKSLKAGDVITPDAVRSVRPGFGVSPKYLDIVVGKFLKRDIVANTPVSFDDFRESK